jgi:predicted DNA-binding protein with PD1-like motif
MTVMIFFQGQQNRRFLGSLQEGCDLVRALEDRCREYRIRCGDIRGAGHLRDVQLAHYDPIKKELIAEATRRAGPFTLVSLEGTISHAASGGTQLALYGMLTDGRTGGNPFGGRIVSADVFYLEFAVQSLDDVTFVREQDPQSGLPVWLNVQTPRRPEHGETEHRKPMRTDRVTWDESSALDDEVELSPGDILDHPRLGRCVVESEADDDRIRIRLANDRIVDLHLGLVSLTVTGQESGKTVYSVRVRRRLPS